MSIPKIAKVVRASKSSVSGWVKDIELTEEQLNALKSKGQKKVAERNKTEKRKRQNKHQKKGAQRVGKLSNREFMLVGATLYWGEGHKTPNGVVGLTNADPMVISLFVKWLHIFFNVSLDKMKIQLNIHSDMDEVASKNFWKQVTGFSDKQFYKTQIAKNTVAGIKKKQNYRGTATVRLCNTNLQFEIQGMLKQLADVAQLAE